MKRLIIISIITCAVLSATGVASATILVDYDFEDPLFDADAPSSPPGSTALFITAGNIIRNCFGTAPVGAPTRPPEGSFWFSGQSCTTVVRDNDVYTATATSIDGAFEWTMSPVCLEPHECIFLDTYSFVMHGEEEPIAVAVDLINPHYEIRWSKDCFAAPIASGPAEAVAAGGASVLYEGAFVNLAFNGAVTFRLELYDYAGEVIVHEYDFIFGDEAYVWADYENGLDDLIITGHIGRCPETIPEPTTAALLGLGCLGALIRRGRRQGVSAQ
ncbi:MAG: PEP-CTERM sorting domain-containing protein [Candidatus Omnitrophica bacterium]|nr:PEP-CTERM sorting domain-containing protein [Candidatus Omnitrophota bacterium]